MSLEITSAILCDLVRTEDTGKQILIGVYTGDVLFERFPAAFAPTFWIGFKPSIQNAEMEFELRIEAPGPNKPRINPFKLPIERQKTVLLVVSVEKLEITGPGPLRFSIRLKGGRWTQVLSKDVALKKSEPPTG
jgi:hypothetical protein